ncbi:peptidylprolyl isomerase [Pseudidiomarina sp. E22-M8]|uniref:peptidylprolyl isomerase n=1 Tax=Pseudidiomarina sp. E22-M8 TaxID=3424768 RepID=UPI00403CE96F
MKSFVRRLFIGFFITLSTLSVSAQEIQPDNPFPRVKLVTSHGEIVVELNRHRAPLTVKNFLKYVDIGSYDNTIFHRIVPGFVVQGGGYDQQLGAKTVGAKIPNESGNGLKNKYGTIAMARENDPHTATRQFFFNVKDNPSLDSIDDWGYAVFGVIASGYETLDKLAEVESLPYHAETGWRDFPAEPPVLISAEVLPQP